MSRDGIWWVWPLGEEGIKRYRLYTLDVGLKDNKTAAMLVPNLPLEILLNNVSTVRLSIQRGNAIGSLLHYTKNAFRSLCTSLRNHVQKKRTKSFGRSRDRD